MDSNKKWTIEDTKLFVENHQIIASVYIAGIQKCGTTTLAEQLNSHLDDLSYGSAKEHHFFDRKYKNYFENVRSKFSREFDHFEEGKIMRSFDATPDYANTLTYMFWEKPRPPSPWPYHRAWTNLSDIASFYTEEQRKKLSFIISFCDPVKRFLSHHNRIDHTWPDPNIHFDTIMGKPELDEDNFIERGLYGDIMEQFFNYFPKSEFLLLSSEYFFQNQAEVLTEISIFLGLEPYIPTNALNTSRNFNLGKKKKYELEARVENYLAYMYYPQIKKLESLVKDRATVKTIPGIDAFVETITHQFNRANWTIEQKLQNNIKKRLNDL